MLQKAEIVKASEPDVILASHTYGGTHPNYTITDLSGRVYECTASCQPSRMGLQPTTVGSLKLPNETAKTFELVPGTEVGNTRNMTVTSDGVTYTYAKKKQGAGYLYEEVLDNITITGPEGFNRFVEITNTPIGTSGAYRKRIDFIRNSQNQKTSYEYDNLSRVKKVTFPN